MYIFAIVLQGFKALRSLLNSNTLYLVSKKEKLRLRLEGFMFDYKLECAARKMMLITNKRKQNRLFRASFLNTSVAGEKQVRRRLEK